MAKLSEALESNEDTKDNINVDHADADSQSDLTTDPISESENSGTISDEQQTGGYLSPLNNSARSRLPDNYILHRLMDSSAKAKGLDPLRRLKKHPRQTPYQQGHYSCRSKTAMEPHRSYSDSLRDRVKTQYNTRLNVKFAEIKILTEDHENPKFAYTRRACNPESYQGHRLDHESQRNNFEWALAWFKPALRGKTKLAQRAADSWRKNEANENLRSRRVRSLVVESSKLNLAEEATQSGSGPESGRML